MLLPEMSALKRSAVPSWVLLRCVVLHHDDPKECSAGAMTKNPTSQV